MVLDRVCNGYRSCILGGLNGWIKGRVRADITGDFGVSGEHDMVEEWCSSVLKGDYAWVAHTLSTVILHEYISVARGLDGVEVKSIIDLGLVKKYMLCYMQNVRALRGMGRGLSDHYVVL